MSPSFTSPSCRRHASGGFALVLALSLMAFVLLLLLSITTLVRVESQSAAINTARLEAEQAALLGLQVALGELQKAAGPDQRITATADILANDASKAAVAGRHRWAGVWDTSDYNPADPGTRTFTRWLVSSAAPGELTNDTAAQVATLANSFTIFEAVDASGNPDPDNDVIVDKIPIATAGSTRERSYAYWVEDESVKADLAWNEGTFDDDARQQAARLSAMPGVDYDVFAGDLSSPFQGQVEHPLEAAGSDNSWHANLSKVVGTDDLPLVTGSSGDASDWLKSVRHDITFGSRAVLCDVKNGGLRRDLSLAFEMDGDAESKDATLFNQQDGEFVGGSDSLAAIQDVPGTSIRDRYLYRDFQGAGQPFSDDPKMSSTSVVRGPSWSLLRDFANLYKRFKKNGSTYELDARAYFPNRTTPVGGGFVEDLFDIHAHKNGDNFQIPGRRAGPEGNIRVNAANQEVNWAGAYAYRPLQASYAPVLLGVNAVFSLAHNRFGDQRMELFVDPFFILWNPYDVAIKAERFAVTMENGIPAGLRFDVTDVSEGTVRQYGKAPENRGNGNNNLYGADTGMIDFAQQKSGGSGGSSYMISDLEMQPGEVLIVSAPRQSERSAGANTLNDELKPGLNYGGSSGVIFDEFPRYNDETLVGWEPMEVADDDKIKIRCNLFTQQRGLDLRWALKSYFETSLPAAGTTADQLADESAFGDHLQGKELRLSSGPFWQPNSRLPLAGPGRFRYGEWTSRDTYIGYTSTTLGNTYRRRKRPFGMFYMLMLPTDQESSSMHAQPPMEVFSMFNVTAAVSVNTEAFQRSPLNTQLQLLNSQNFNQMLVHSGIDLDPDGGANGFYGYNYTSFGGDKFFPLLSLPKAPMHSLVQFSSANLGTRLLEPTHAIGNSWVPPYLSSKDSIYRYYSANGLYDDITWNDVSWQINDALFDRYYLSGLAPAYTIGSSGYAETEGVEATLERFYGSDPLAAEANPVLQPYIPEGMTPAQVTTLLEDEDGYLQLGAFSLIRGAFNVNSTSVKAWSALLRGNRDLATESLQGTTDAGDDATPFPLTASPSDVGSENGWEQLSRLTNTQIDLLAEKIVDEVRARGPFMSLSDFVNRRIVEDSAGYQGALQQAIETADINAGIRSATSDEVPDYTVRAGSPNLEQINSDPGWRFRGFTYTDLTNIFDLASNDPGYVGNRNCAVGIPKEINQANVLLPIAPKLTARSDTFKIRAYGEVVSVGGEVVQAVCEATVQRVPEYVNETDAPWDENYLTPQFPSGVAQLDAVNQNFGRKFKITKLRWLEQSEL